MHPYVRLFFLIGCIFGIILLNYFLFLSFFYALVILPLFITQNQLKPHFKLIILGIIPIFISYIVIYIFVLECKNGGWDFISLRLIKLLLFTSVFQLVLTIHPDLLIFTLKKWRFNNEALIVTLGAFTVWRDVKYKAEKIVTARFATGLIPKRSFLNISKQLPYVLIPLFIGIIRTSSERAALWEQKNILYLIENYQINKIKFSLSFNLSLLLMTLSWVILSILWK